MATKTAVVYCRTSTSQQKESETIEAQRQRCARIVEREGLTVLRHVEDDGCTGTLLDGRNFAMLLTDLENKKLRPDYLVVFSISRLSRVEKSHTSTMEKLQQSHAAAARIQATLIGTRVTMLDEEGPCEPASLTFQLKMVLANEELRAIRARTMAGKARRLSAGKFAKGGKAPFGYRQVPANGDRKHGFDLVADPDEAPRLKAIFGWFVAGGVTEAARKATEAAYPTPMATTDNRKGKAKDWSPTRWSPVSVQHLVRRARSYLGEMTYEFADETHTIKCEPLIDLKMFAAIEARRKVKTLKRRATFLSTGFVVCTCGAPVHERNSHDKHYSRCSGDRCGSLHQPVFETMLWHAVVSRLMQIAAHQRTANGGADPYGPELQAARGALAAVQERIGRLLDLFEGGDLDKTTYRKRVEPLNNLKASAQAEVERVEREKDAHEQKRVTEETVESRVGALLKELAGSTEPTLDRKRQVLGELLATNKVVVGWPPKPKKKAAKPVCSPYASITLPSFAGLPPVTFRTDEDIKTEAGGWGMIVIKKR
jgi:DNA invertase Pin-like site-specific DNA recombinase